MIWDLLKAEVFEDLADLTAALKDRCGQLRIRWTPDDINEAFRLVGSHTPLVRPPARVPRRREELPSVEIFSRAEAVEILRQIVARSNGDA